MMMNYEQLGGTVMKEKKQYNDIIMIMTRQTIIPFFMEPTSEDGNVRM